MISVVCLIIASLCFILAAIGRPAWPFMPVGLCFLTLAFLFGDMGGLSLDSK
jgi:uncharacterized membrane protein YccC